MAHFTAWQPYINGCNNNSIKIGNVIYSALMITARMLDTLCVPSTTSDDKISAKIK